MHIARPSEEEYAPYALTYINAAAADITAGGHADLLALLRAQPRAWHTLLDSAPPSLAGFAYAPGKWTLAESIVHVSDTERVFAYRLMRFARGDRTALPPFEQDEWVPQSRASRRTLVDVLDELDAVRGATVALVSSLDDEAIAQIGVASGRDVSARAMIWMIAGHAAHHLRLTKEKYVGA
ncbi:MAG: DinB family protein [Gemmatimonadaceae bacterium]|nr:DinB family protein [Gemmatimonadaceae bacterium]